MASVSSSSGTGTIDVASIVSQLMTVERQPLAKLDTREASYQATLSAFGGLSAALSSFQGTMKTVTPTALTGVRSSVSDTSVLTASASAAATPGNYSIEVSRLAAAQKLVGTGQAARNTAIGAGHVTITLGTISGGSFDATAGTYSGASFTPGSATPVQFDIAAPNNTLDGIRDAINAANAGVTATIVNDGGATPYRLVLTGNKTGAASSVKIDVTGDAALQSLLANDPAGTQNMAQRATAADAAFTVDGIAMTKASNTVTDAIDGVTLTLAKPTAPNTPVTVNLSRDTTTAGALAKNFVDAVNTVFKAINSISKPDASGKTTGMLHADPTVTAIASRLRTMLTSPITGAGNITSLTQLGMTWQRDGTMKLDADKFQAAMTASAANVAAALGTGMAAPLSGYVDNVVGTGGVIANRTDGINTSLTRIDKQRDAMNARLSIIEARYRTQYTKLDAVLSNMQATQTYLTSQMTMLQNLYTNNK